MHWEDPEGSGREGGGREDGDGERKKKKDVKCDEAGRSTIRSV